MAPETIAGRYRVERAVGRGGMGTVWLCHDEVLGRPVAIKRIGMLPGESTADMDRAMREARSAAALNHPNVVPVFDSVEADGDIWLVMEYLPSRTLGELLEAEGTIPPERAARIGAQVADGLAAAHERGIVHRDVKPGNILVTDADRAKITDFGIARVQGDPQLTRAGLLTGTPGYLPPEVVRGEDPDLPGDVWALAVTLYRAVEGHGPFPDHDNPIVTLTAIASEEPAPSTRAGVLTEPIRRMLERDPASRWTMAQAARSLHDIGTSVRQDESPTRAVPLSSLAAAPVAAAAVDREPTPEPVPAPAPYVEPAAYDDDRDRRRGGWLPVAAALLLLLGLVGGYLLLRPGGAEDQEPTAGEPSTSQSQDPTPDPSPSEQASEDEGTGGGGTNEEPAEEPAEEPTQDPTTAEPTPTPSPSEDETEEEPEEQQPVAAGGAAQFVTGYYGQLPGGTESTWRMLSPSLQNRIGRDSYFGFWNTISSVSVQGTRAVDADTVDVTILYNGSETETRRIDVARAGGGYVMVGDQVVG